MKLCPVCHVMFAPIPRVTGAWGCWCDRVAPVTDAELLRVMRRASNKRMMETWTTRGAVPRRVRAMMRAELRRRGLAS